MKDPKLYMLHVVECIAKIRRYSASGRESLNDGMVMDAVLRKPSNHERGHATAS